MTKMKSLLALAAVGAVAVLLAVSPGTPNAAAPVAWEYMTISRQQANLAQPPRSLVEALNDAGREGWEAVGLGAREHNEIVLLKRAIAPATTPTGANSPKRQ